MTAPARSSTGVPGAVWTTSSVARRLGVAPGTLRSWSRRYGIGPAAHTAGRHRRYTDADIATLDTMRDLVAQGMVLSAAATIARHHHQPGSAQRHGGSSRTNRAEIRAPASSPADAVSELAAAATRLDLDTATGILAAGLDTHGVIATWEHLCRPALIDLDPAVAADRGCTDAQLLLSWAISTCLRRVPATFSGPAVRPVLLACVAGEQHTLPLEALFAALVERQVPARMLGAAVPGTALLHAARQLRPAAAVVWAQRPVAAGPDAPHGLALHTDTVLAAGPGWHHSVLPPGAIRVGELTAALDLITDQVAVTVQVSR